MLFMPSRPPPHTPMHTQPTTHTRTHQCCHQHMSSHVARPIHTIKSKSVSNMHSSLPCLKTPAVSGTSVSVFLRLGLPPSRGHPSQGHPSRRHPRLLSPRRMAQRDIPEMERHEDGGSIRLSFPNQGHPPVPSVSAIRLGDIPLGRPSRGHPSIQVK